MQLDDLKAITEPKPLTQLTQKQLKELQTALKFLGYPVGKIDGLLGPRTRTAWAEYKTDVFEGNPDLIGPQSIAVLISKVDRSVNSPDFSTKEGTMAAIVKECTFQGLTLSAQIAYVLATVEWETAKTFRPVREAFWLSEEWRRKNLRYYPYYGRGYVQLTWKYNYENYSELLDIDLVKTPDLAMEPDTALFILVHGFRTGNFTGRKITDYINEVKTDLVGARRCINGTDHDNDIAHLTQKYLIVVPDNQLLAVSVN
ncbi:carboxypeptidase [Fibrisoma montanum]|uniref:Carboxypeptidase n=1 Tax=Fibrisoma montanum TaxID=2305895 RepID=A0A418MAL2_9BACT|nr:glycoside hydrolase family 19 protein [Fibrisoma montanum]RIV23390.1 carboxypeptidase [Fibrisoma montanum]